MPAHIGKKNEKTLLVFAIILKYVFADNIFNTCMQVWKCHCEMFCSLLGAISAQVA